MIIFVSGAYVLGNPLGFKPNIVILLADDLGYGDVGCYGNTTLRTPNMDALAQDGVKLTHHLAAESVCTPSRAALLTGRYPIRTGFIPTTVIRVDIFVANYVGLPDNETTIAELAKTVGYKTALIGKWHLGLSKETYGDNKFHPMNQGFDYYYGHILTNMKDFSGEGDRVVLSQQPNFYKICFSAIVISIISTLIIKKYEVVEQPIHLETLHDRYTKEGVEFIEDRSKDNNPFLLMMSYDHVHTALRTSERFRGKSKHGRYGDAVEELDDGIGEIMNALDRFGFGRNTLVYMTSDNGAHLEESGVNGEVDGGSNGIFRGGKTHGAVEGGIRIPGIIRFPTVLPSNIVIDEPTMQMDTFTTFANLIGAELPQNTQIDGKDLFPLLKRKSPISPHRFFYHYCDGALQAARYRPKAGNKVWKLVYETPNYLPGQNRCLFTCVCSESIKLENPLLYEINSDPGEEKPLNLEDHKEIVLAIEEAVKKHKESIQPTPPMMDFYKMLWRPHMQPCCNFPYCSCRDPVYQTT
ncbi:hypothetical protein FSP39_001629 [Pinctada imbricata]|uniref:Sulfatase N-terminal domain-containing protein n=1 Tax=Pinctada imbricata TaxID=66713 RepID=A0AA88XXW0_PINIB|nr:hypothetical protein FSP39_001629 [Pinctada imbricata]